MAWLTGFPPSRKRAAWRLVACVLGVEAVALASIYGYELVRLRVNQNGMTYNATPAGSRWWKVEGEGITRPPALGADEAGLDPNEEVIGVAVGGKARAYRLRAFLDPSSHIVNDLIEQTPVSVAYCDISDCTRVYTGPKGGGPLDIAQAGLRDGDMVVKIGGVPISHKSGTPIDPTAGPPSARYELLPTTRMTWGEWRRLHPDTDVYVGERKARRPRSEP